MRDMYLNFLIEIDEWFGATHLCNTFVCFSIYGLVLRTYICSCVHVSTDGSVLRTYKLSDFDMTTNSTVLRTLKIN